MSQYLWVCLSGLRFRGRRFTTARCLQPGRAVSGNRKAGPAPICERLRILGSRPLENSGGWLQDWTIKSQINGLGTVWSVVPICQQDHQWTVRKGYEKGRECAMQRVTPCPGPGLGHHTGQPPGARTKRLIRAPGGPTMAFPRIASSLAGRCTPHRNTVGGDGYRNQPPKRLVRDEGDLDHSQRVERRVKPSTCAGPRWAASWSVLPPRGTESAH